ncbi:MAG: neutral/alkaline non-lysosomal ceramidase N-terminal domain-containing protein [Planctomycetes bacterium]|nr:neutral/alkaline non-lysosomal ceramidase N-terminal domain-containing protein [Planctomycetota bacterium]
MKTTIGATLFFLLIAPHVHAAPLQAGAARIDITPPIGFPMWGYASRKDAPSTGVRDPLFARAVVLAVGTKKLALVGLDLGRAPTRSSMARIRKQLKTATGIETVFLVASHTHHGPVLELDDWPSKEKPYTRTLETKLVRAIVEANKKLQLAQMGITALNTPFSRNRHSKRADRPVDKEMLIARIDTADGKPIAHLVHFAAHPTMLPAKLRAFSPDFPGFLSQHVEKELGGVCLFLQGAAGDLSPNPPGPATPENFGTALGKFVVEKSKKLKCEMSEVKDLKARERDFKFRARLDISNPLIYAAYSIAFFPKLVNFYEREYREGIRPHLTTALLDGRIGFVGVSGELFTSHAIHLKRRARLPHLFVFGYCNDYQQYFPTIEAVAEGGYGADMIVSPVEVGAGERMMDQALMDLLELQGKSRPR